MKLHIGRFVLQTGPSRFLCHINSSELSGVGSAESITSNKFPASGGFSGSLGGMHMLVMLSKFQNALPNTNISTKSEWVAKKLGGCADAC